MTQSIPPPAPDSFPGPTGRDLCEGTPPDRRALAPAELSSINSLGALGSLEIRLAESVEDIRRAQRLRYEVFYEEGNARPDLACLAQRRDEDAFDPICDHLLVIDHGCVGLRPKTAKVVGTYRLLRRDVAERHGGFYTAAEFDIEPLLRRRPHTRFLELGRSCVLAPYRDKRIVELLWHGIWAYVRRHRIDAMFGCASFEGTDLAALAQPLRMLHRHALSPEPWLVRPVPGRAVPMDLAPCAATDMRDVLARLPPLLKGYLRVGATVGDGAVVDEKFAVTDVFVILPVEAIARRYLAYFGPRNGPSRFISWP